ncbi:hypothetical protein SLEP1_g25824 [Rubroshorea leprosula]|uniref:Uncharacterized protein n=1 Tax=Rubroshorea leprosula TaxID=152421 RepID=A0AAV5JKC3_9ROSI|nr:hypothetical protein SLEP1_g25824 [Rubroshorea leprosula]
MLILSHNRWLFGVSQRIQVVRIVSYEKIVVVANPNGFTTVYESMIQVFTVGTTGWKKKGATPPQFWYGSPQALVERSLHWLMVVRME